MKPNTKGGYFSIDKNRLFVTLMLAVVYPISCTAIFPIFVFLILPITPLVSAAAMCLYAYWLIAAGIWLLGMAIILPQMRSEPLQESPGLDVDPDNLDLQRIKVKGSCDDILDEVKGDPNRRSSSCVKEDAVESRRSSNVSNEFRERLLENSTQQPEIRASEERVVKSAAISTVQRGSEGEISSEGEPLLEENGRVVVKESVASKKTTTQHMETSVTSTTMVQETYECSLPSPIPTSGDGQTKNTVFIFVNSEDDNSVPAEKKD